MSCHPCIGYRLASRNEASKLLALFRGRPSGSAAYGLWDASSTPYAYVAQTAEQLLDLFLKVGALSRFIHIY